MAQFKKAVITAKGLALIQKSQMQGIRLEFIKIVTGSGEYAETEEVGGATDIKEPKQEFPISSVAAVDQQTIKLASVLSNKDLQQSYYMREIGIYAADPDEGEILYSLAVAYPGKADYMPAYDGTAPVTIGLDTYQSVSDSASVSIRADPAAYALAKDLEDLRKTVKNIPVNVSKEIIIPKDGWIEDAGVDGYHVDITDPDITDTAIPILTVWIDSMEAAQDCGMLPTVMSMNGALRVYARNVPKEDLRCSLTLTGVAAGMIGGGTSGSGPSTGDGSYVLPIASKTRLGGVKIGEGVTVNSDGTIAVDGEAVAEKVIATPDEVRAMLEAVHGE